MALLFDYYSIHTRVLNQQCRHARCCHPVFALGVCILTRLVSPSLDRVCASSLHRYEWVQYLGEGKGTALWGPISQWDTSSVTRMYLSFSAGRNAGGNSCGGCNIKAELFNADLSEWITSAVTDMHGLFIDARAFTGSLAKWNVGKVTKMHRTFTAAYLWNGDISKWNVAGVRRMTEQLCVCRAELIISADK